jgi:hypothetical protein
MPQEIPLRLGRRTLRISCEGVEPPDVFWSTHYMRHNQRRQEHLASLGLNLASQTVLELGAGIGDHTRFFLDRQCTVVVTEAQDQNLAILRSRYPDLDVRKLDLDQPPRDVEHASIVYCYGTLYHLEQPAAAIAWMSKRTENLMLLETCVAYGESEVVHPFEEHPGQPDNAIRGHGCRPTRAWLRRELARHLPYVYCTSTQPWHSEFPLDWSDPRLASEPLIRAVFVASRSRIESPVLTTSIPVHQVRH